MKRIFLMLAACLLAGTAAARTYDKVVAQDGSGDYKTIQEAILSCKHFYYYPTYIFVKNGVYKEKLEIPSWITDVVLIGENRDSTIITNDDHSGKVTPLGRINTFTSYTLKVLGARTHLLNFTIENAALQRGQAVALHIEADGILVKNCRILGNQDTIYANGEKDETLMVDCYVEGTTDYIFGSAQLFMDNCTLHCKRKSYITAASTPRGREFGFAIFNSKITAAPGVTGMLLGRPWRIYAKTVFLNCEMGDFIHPKGWMNWGKPQAESHVFYGEYMTRGTDVSERVAWSRQLTQQQAQKYYDELDRMRRTYLTPAGLGPEI